MAGKVMQAVQYEGYGGGVAGLKHVEVPVPSPKKDQVLIKVEASAINPIDWKIQKGALRPFLPKKFPMIPAIDVAGEVVEVGSGVQKFKAGDKVVAMLDFACGGALAEYAVAAEKLTVKKPPEVSAPDAAGLTTAAMMALQMLNAVGFKLDGSGSVKNILVTGASGGVGHYAVQLAKVGNAHVTATCGARNIEFVKSLGADEVLDYKTPDGAALKSPSGCTYDAVIHCSGSPPWSVIKRTLSTKAKVADINAGFGAFLSSGFQKLTCANKRLLPLFLSGDGTHLQQLVDLVKDGKLKTVIDSKYPLSRAEDAWTKLMECHATGKIIVEP